MAETKGWDILDLGERASEGILYSLGREIPGNPPADPAVEANVGEEHGDKKYGAGSGENSTGREAGNYHVECPFLPRVDQGSDGCGSATLLLT